MVIILTYKASPHRRVSGFVARVACVFTILASSVTAACMPARMEHVAPRHVFPVGQTIQLSQYPFAVIDDPQTQRLFVLNGATINAAVSSSSSFAMSSASVIDAASGTPVHAQPLQGNVGLAMQGTNVPAVIDPRTGEFWLLVGPRLDANGVAHGQGGLILLDGQTGRLIRSITLGPQPHGVGINGYNGIGMDSGGRHIFLSDSQYVLILDVTTGRSLGVVPGGGARFQVVTDVRHGRVYLLSGTEDVALDERTDAVLTNTTIPTRGQEVADAFVLDTQAAHILVDLYDEGADANRVCVVALTSGRVIRCIDAVGGRFMAVDATTHRAFAIRTVHGSGEGPFTIDTLDTRSGRLVRTETTDALGDASTMISIAVDERVGRVFVTRDTPTPYADARGQLIVLDATTGRVIRRTSTGRGTWEAGPAVAVDLGTGHVFVANTIDKTISVFDAKRL